MATKRVEYRCITTSAEGFVQQVAVQYLRHGYWFYVAGQIPEAKDPTAVDAKLIKKYGIDVSRWERARLKQAGLANMQYIRNGRLFLLMATHGDHRFFEDEAGQIRDARRYAIPFAGHSLSFRNGRACVRMEANEYRRVKACLVDLAYQGRGANIESAFLYLPFVPYAPVRQQLLQIWRAVNRVRLGAGLEGVPIECVRWKRPIVKPFGEYSETAVSAFSLHRLGQ